MNTNHELISAASRVNLSATGLHSSFICVEPDRYLVPMVTQRCRNSDTMDDPVRMKDMQTAPRMEILPAMISLASIAEGGLE